MLCKVWTAAATFLLNTLSTNITELVDAGYSTNLVHLSWRKFTVIFCLKQIRFQMMLRGNYKGNPPPNWPGTSTLSPPPPLSRRRKKLVNEIDF